MTQITSGRIKLAEYARSVHVVTVPQGVTLAEATNPAYWAHVAQQIKPRDRIELWAEDRAWFADAVVISAQRLSVSLKVLQHVRLDPVKADAIAIPGAGYHVQYGGGVDLWRVIRDADSLVMTSGLSQAEAEKWIADHVSATAASAFVTEPVGPIEVPAVPAPETSATTSPQPETPETRAAVVIPDNWQGLSWQERRSLASQLSDKPIHNGTDANAAIEAELKKRAAAE